MFAKIAQRLDSLGFRRLVAMAATAAYRGQRFSVDDRGRWRNEQSGGTIVSNTIHTMHRRALDRMVERYWFHAYRPKEGDVVLDIGAGIGEEAVVMSNLVGPAGRIFSIEAHPATFKCLEQTIALSGLGNVEAIHCAVADSDGTAMISDSEEHLANSIMVAGDVEVPQRTIASLLAERGIKRVDFLRMNIEGAERVAVKGMAGLDVRHVCISCHDFCGLPSKAEVVAELERQGFTVTGRAAPHDEPWLGDYVDARPG